jgi:hypothetical protein
MLTHSQLVQSSKMTIQASIPVIRPHTAWDYEQALRIILILDRLKPIIVSTEERLEIFLVERSLS